MELIVATTQPSQKFNPIHISNLSIVGDNNLSTIQNNFPDYQLHIKLPIGVTIQENHNIEFNKLINDHPILVDLEYEIIKEIDHTKKIIEVELVPLPGSA